MQKGTCSWAARIRAGIAVGAAFLAVAAGAGEAAEESTSAALLKARFRLDVSEQVGLQAEKLAAPCGEADAAEVAAAADAWKAREIGAIRAALEARFGEKAREAFGTFADTYAKAEAAGDTAFLRNLAGEVGGWDETPADYAALREGAVQSMLRDEIAAAGRFLADVQTWVALKAEAKDVPPLAAWLARGAAPAGAGEVASDKPARPAKRNRLRDSEAQAESFEAEPEEDSGALEGFGAARQARREKALEAARAGMQQIAEERRAAEEELAAKKTAAAQAEADAVRKQAEKLAAAQSEAIEQRKNSWSGRLKSILTATIGATSGAFLGNVGGRAGEAAANAIFNEEDHHGRGHDRGD